MSVIDFEIFCRNRAGTLFCDGAHGNIAAEGHRAPDACIVRVLVGKVYTYNLLEIKSSFKQTHLGVDCTLHIRRHGRRQIHRYSALGPLAA